MIHEHIISSLLSTYHIISDAVPLGYEVVRDDIAAIAGEEDSSDSEEGASDVVGGDVEVIAGDEGSGDSGKGGSGDDPESLISDGPGLVNVPKPSRVSRRPAWMDDYEVGSS